MPNLTSLDLVSRGGVVWARKHGLWGRLWMMQAWGAGKGLEEEGRIMKEGAAEEGLGADRGVHECEDRWAGRVGKERDGEG